MRFCASIEPQVAVARGTKTRSRQNDTRDGQRTVELFNERFCARCAHCRCKALPLRRARAQPARANARQNPQKKKRLNGKFGTKPRASAPQHRTDQRQHRLFFFTCLAGQPAYQPTCTRHTNTTAQRRSWTWSKRLPRTRRTATAQVLCALTPRRLLRQQFHRWQSASASAKKMANNDRCRGVHGWRTTIARNSPRRRVPPMRHE